MQAVASWLHLYPKMSTFVYWTMMICFLINANGGAAGSVPQVLNESYDSSDGNQEFLPGVPELSETIQELSPGFSDSSETIIPDMASIDSYLEETLEIHCVEMGVFPVPGSCTEFYFCADWNGLGQELSISRFTCPAGNFFDSASQQCLPPTSNRHIHCKVNVLTDRDTATNNEPFINADRELTPAAISDNTINRERKSLRLRKRSTHCSQDIVQNVTKSSQEACVNSRNINAYINNIKSKQPIKLASFNEEEFKGIIRDYNRDLETTHNHYNEWRHGSNSIFNGLQEIFQLAKQFEPKFNQKFGENNARVETFRNENFPDLRQMEVQIESLQEEISDLGEMLSQISDESPRRILEHLQTDLKKKQIELNQILMNDRRLLAEKELQEIKSFLNFVKNTAAEIQHKCQSTGIRLEDFHDKIVQDSGIFVRHRRTVEEGIERLHTKKTNDVNQRTKDQNAKRNLENAIQEDRSNISHYRTVIQDTERDLKDIEATIKKKETEARNKKIAGGVLFAVPIYGWIAGSVLVAVGVTEEKNLAEQKRNIIKNHQSLIDSYNAQINQRNSEIQNAQDRITTLNAEIKKLEDEISYFRQLDQDLATVDADINSILPSLNKALESVGNVKTVFDGIQDNLDDITDVAISRHKNTVDKDLVELIYYGISELKCKWDQMSVKIVDLQGC